MILEINEVGQKLHTQFNLHFSWFDFRLKFYDLKVNVLLKHNIQCLRSQKKTSMNTLSQKEKDSIWVPMLEFRKVLKSSTKFRN